MTRRGIAPRWRAAPTSFVLAWGGNHFTPLLHVYEHIGGYAPWQANLLLGMYVFGLIPGLLVAASLSDKHGRKPIALCGLISAAGASVILALSMESFVLLCIGRALAGIGVGIGMSVGSSWVKELSQSPWDQEAAATSGARRSSMALTLGFAIGAGVTGALAQWAPLPGQLPYVVHLVLCVVAFSAWATTAGEPVGRAARAGSMVARSACAGHRPPRVPTGGAARRPVGVRRCRCRLRDPAERRGRSAR